MGTLFLSVLTSVSPAQIIFRSERSGNGDIYVMDADGTNLIRFTNDVADEGAASSSPDGTKIAFVSFVGPANDDIYVMNADGSSQLNLTNHPANDGLPSWFPVSPTLTAVKGKLATQWGQIKSNFDR